MEKDSKIIKCFCCHCKRKTNHRILFSKTESCGEDDSYWWQSTYSIVECLGCEGIQFYKEDVDESDYEASHYEGIEVVPRTYTYPQKENLVDPIENTWYLPASVKTLYVQTMECLNSTHLQLAAAGFRAIIEAICKEAGVTGRNLESMINNLAKAHLITANDRDHLHAIRFMGNDSIHSVKVYRGSELCIVAHIVNTILTSLYVISREVEDLDIMPITKFEDFEDLLDGYISKRNVGDVDTLRSFIQKDRRVMSEDFPKFESELRTRITNGRYKHLSIISTSQHPQPPQQYKVESIQL